MVEDQDFRHWLCGESLYWFSQYYFWKPSYAETPNFHREIFHSLEQLKEETYLIAAGRGMGKSTLANLYYILWRILCREEKFVVLLSRTQRQADQLLENVRDELEDNERILQDFGPINKVNDQWGRAGLEIGNYEAKIIAGSMEQSLRGMKHRHHRPGLFVLDDIEDSASVKSAEARDKLLEWYQRDVVPAGDEHTKIVILGGILHPNSFVSHMRELILEGKVPGTYREYPFLDENGKSLWIERYPDRVAVDRLRLKAGSDITWRQEYLLQIVTTENQIIPYEWFSGQDYEDFPDRKHLARILISVDPASSKKKHADCTGIIVLSVYHVDGRRKVYVHGNSVNQKLSGMEIEDKIVQIYDMQAKQGPVEILIETTSQDYLVERIRARGKYVKEYHPKGDKSERLKMAGAPLQAKLVFFAKKGCEDLKAQLTGFGYERYDDLVDAFSQGINEVMVESFLPNLDTIAFG
jgi:phage terminase large subunit-like protein